MGAWGKFITGSLDALFGRPAGARARAVDAPDQVVETSPPTYEITVEPSGPGLEIVMPFTLLQDLPERTRLLVWLRNESGYVEASHPPWADEDGDLVLEAKWWEDDVGDTSWVVFLPFVALPDDCPTSVELQTRLIVDDVVLYEELWNIEVPTLEERLEGNLLGAHACAAVRLAEAGSGLQREHVRTMKQELGARFELDDYGLEMLRRVQKRAAAGEDDPARWQPALETLDEEEQLTLASDLVAMARLSEDGYVEAQAQFLVELFEQVGFDASIWHELLELDDEFEDQEEEEDETDATPVTLEAHFITLELTTGATWEEVRAAYKRLARDYHPDTVATLPRGFQQFATETMARLNEAYEALRKHFRR